MSRRDHKPGHMVEKLKRLLPTSLFKRALLILVLPTVLLQIIATFIFFDRHWDNISRHMSSSLAGQVALLVHEIRRSSEDRRQELYSLSEALMGINITHAAQKNVIAYNDVSYEDFAQALSQRLPLPTSITADPDNNDRVLIQIATEEGVFSLRVSKKRLVSSTTHIFILWMLGTAIILTLIATLFLRNQIRPIIKLAEAAENFGKGLDTPDFRPHGATEVRKAARAFIIMRDRIKRQVISRTEMLAGISHDLRTPLTRMKLQLAMQPDSQATRGLQSDVQEMERMIEEYLQFARGEVREHSKPVDIMDFLSMIADDYRRQHQEILLEVKHNPSVVMRPGAFKRCMNNLIDNALHYAGRCILRSEQTAEHIYLYVDDDGPGIPEASRSLVFQPFKRLDPSRNNKTGGIGLGLSIARDIVFSHGGRIELLSSPEGGLRVSIKLPL